MSNGQEIELAKEAIKDSIEAAKEFAGKLISPGLEEGGGIIQDTIKFWRFKNQINILLKAKQFLEEKGIKPQKVLPKTLVPLLENGSLEEDEDMQNRWAALLSNAANPEINRNIKPAFIEILKELSPLEAKLLDLIYDEIHRTGNDLSRPFIKDKICATFNINEMEFKIIADNLFRLNVCQPAASSGGTGIGGPGGEVAPFVLRTYSFIHMSPLGVEFVKSCRAG
jgi:NurA-like 5'-3' nuclease